MKELQRQANPNIVIALAGNKADLANKRMVDYEVSGMSVPRRCAMICSIGKNITNIIISTEDSLLLDCNEKSM